MNNAIHLNIRIPPFLFTVFSEYFETLLPLPTITLNKILARGM